MRNYARFNGIECDVCKASWKDLPGFVAHLDADGECPRGRQETIA